MNNHFKDESPFQGIIEFTTNTGETVQAHNDGHGYKIYIKQNDDAFLYQRFVEIKSKNPIEIWEAFLEEEND